MNPSEAEIEREAEAGDPDRWERGELRKSKEVSATLSFRVSVRVAGEIEMFADAHQMSVSDLLRRAVERYLGASDTGTYSNTYFAVFGTTWNAPLALSGPTTLRAFRTSSAFGETIPAPPPLPLLEYGAKVAGGVN